MPSSTNAACGASRPSFWGRPGNTALAAAIAWLACAGCDIDDRTLYSGQLRLSSLLDGGLDGGVDAATDAGNGDGIDPQPTPTGPVVDEARPIRALGDEVATALLGGFTGRDDRARCVEGVLVGLDYRFNDSSTEPFPSRLTFVRPICAVPNVLDDGVDLS